MNGHLNGYKWKVLFHCKSSFIFIKTLMFLSNQVYMLRYRMGHLSQKTKRLVWQFVQGKGCDFKLDIIIFIIIIFIMMQVLICIFRT